MQTQHDLTPTRVPIDELILHPRNARTHDLPTIKQSLATHGQLRAITRQKSTGWVLMGNGTTEAARELGWTELDVITLDVDDDQATRILLVDNRASDRGGYDEAGIADLLASLGDDLTGTGYDPGDLDARLAELAIKDRQADSAVEMKDAWEAKDARTVLLTYTQAEHADLCARLDRLAAEHGLDTYSDVARKLIIDATS